MKILSIENAMRCCAVGVLAGLAACESGGGNPAGGGATATGILKDSNVSGLSYVSGSRTGITGPDGAFTYEVGTPVTFSVGGVTIGTATGKSVLTPIDLVSAGSSKSVQVQNIVRFLMMLDQNGDPTDGITISPAVQKIAGTWAPVKFDAADLGAELASIISDAASVDGTPHPLPDPSAAKSHLESTLRCVHSGAFRGTFSGDDNGPFGVLIDAKTGLLAGFAFSNTDKSLRSLSGSEAVSFDRSAAFVSSDASSGAAFNGGFAGPDAISGTWNSTAFSASGTFAGNRIGGVINAAYRFTGRFSGGGDFGLFAFDVDGSDKITGVVYSVSGDELLNLTGTLSGTTLSAKASDGTVITGTLDKAGGVLSGSWVDSAGSVSGTYSGSGCKLNHFAGSAA